jgi:hypothetical protein
MDGVVVETISKKQQVWDMLVVEKQEEAGVITSMNIKK